MNVYPMNITDIPISLATLTARKQPVLHASKTYSAFVIRVFPDCKTSRRGIDYQGKISKTWSGEDCISWIQTSYRD